jgi:uncharacterized protein YndB with AHSA1/START domain
MSTKPGLTLKRRLHALPAKVYGAWTDSTKISRWFGPENAEVLHAETDVCVGGRFRIVFRGPNGEEHDVGGVYSEVLPNEKLVFTWTCVRLRSEKHWSRSRSSVTVTGPC